MRAPTLSQLQTLRAVAEGGSLVSAALALGMTPAALTARVKGLEESVGLTLFDRTSAGLKLNDSGRIALGAARGVEAAVNDFIEALGAVRSARGGRLSVGAVSTAKYFAPQLIAGFVADRPKLDLRFSIGNRDETIESLRRFEIEVVLMGRPPDDLRVEKIPIGPHPYVMIAKPDHPLVGRKRLRREDLEGQTFLVRERGSGTRSLFDAFIGEIEVRSLSLGLELGSNETIKQAVMAGLGVALLSAHTIAAEVANGRLAVLDVAGLPIRREWFLVSRADRALTPVAAAFRDFAKARAWSYLPEPLARRRSGR